LKHGTIREVFSKILYDPNIDPSEIEIIFLDSRNYRCVPFTYISPFEGGFYYRGNFYPFHKIIAIRDKRSGKYFLRRQPIKFRVLGDVGIEIPEFPISLRAVYDDFSLQRYSSFIVLTLLSKIRKNPERAKEWFEILGKSDRYEIEGAELYVITEVGPFRGTIMINEEGYIDIIRSIPTPLKLKNIINLVRFHKVCIQEFKGDLYHIFSSKSGQVFCIENITRIRECDEGVSEEILQILRNGWSIFLLKTNSLSSLIAICDQNEKRFLHADVEIEVSNRINISLAKMFFMGRVKDIVTSFKSSILKIFDDDIIFAVSNNVL